MIDPNRPLTEQTAADLRMLIDSLHGSRERYDRANRIVEARSCELEIAEATRALAIINRRATEALDQQPTAGIQQHEVDTLAAVLRRHDEPEAHALVARMWTALQVEQRSALTADEVRSLVGHAAMAVILGHWEKRVTIDGDTLTHGDVGKLADAIGISVAEKLSGRAVDPTQCEAALREAFMAGNRYSEVDHDENPERAPWETIGSVDNAAAEYARSKAGA
jgi:hypothetical protein